VPERADVSLKAAAYRPLLWAESTRALFGY
jgi:hypothetical protein